MYYHRALGRGGCPRLFRGRPYSSRRFYSLYPEIYDPARLRPVYVIKGGPGFADTLLTWWLIALIKRGTRQIYSHVPQIHRHLTESSSEIRVSLFSTELLPRTLCEPSLPGHAAK